jgi:hypothetical protein
VHAEEILGKTVLVGLTYVTAGGRVTEQTQLHGVVDFADEERGIGIRQASGEVFTLPPAFESFEPADPGEYTLRSTGEVVTDPDLLCSWTITAPPERISEWLDHYDDQLELYQAFANRLERLLRNLLRDREIEFAWLIGFDADTTDLRAEMIDAWRRGEPVANPLEGKFRTVGLKIGLFSPARFRELEELIDDEFVVDPSSSTTRAETEVSGQRITYDQPSYLIALDARRAELPEWAAYAGLKLRIELTTELHDSWTDLLDDLPFRHATSYPDELREALAGLASTLETADAEIGDVVDSVDRLLEEHRESVRRGELDLPLNGITLLSYLHASELVDSLVELAAEVGFRHDPDEWPAWDDLELRPLWLLRRDGVESIAELDAFLRSILPRTRETLGRLLELSEEKGFTPWTWREDMIPWLWLVFRRADAHTVELLHYRDELVYALNTLIGNPMAPTDKSA